MSTRHLLAEAIREEKSLNVCARHPRTVYFDGPHCPCCALMAEHCDGGMFYAKRNGPSLPLPSRR